MPSIVTRAEARAAGGLRYFTGKPCKSGHLEERNVSSGICLGCARAAQAKIRSSAEGRARIAQIKRGYLERNADEAKAAAKRYRDAAPQVQSERCRRWHRGASQDPSYRARKAAATRAWAAEHPDRAAASQSVSRARKRAARPEAFGDFDRFVLEEAFAAARRRKAMTGIDWHVDHMIPLSRGGAHAWHNIQVIPAEVNLWKRNRLIYTEPGQWLDFYGS